MSPLLLATHNVGKIAEFQRMLAPVGVRVVGMAEMNLPAPEEDGGSFEANARLKAVAAARLSSLPALADDSGLCLPGLGGWPGVDTALWTKRERDGLEEINQRLTQTPDHRAESVCVLALALSPAKVTVFEGRVPGQWVWPPRGDGGFGYDPVFVPDVDGTRTYAEMGSAEKSTLSHRTAAFCKLMESGLLKQLQDV